MPNSYTLIDILRSINMTKDALKESIMTNNDNITDYSYEIHNQKIDVYNDAAAYMYDYAWVSIKGQMGLNPPIPKEGKVEVPGIQYTWDETYDGLIDIMEIVLASRLAMKTELDINTDIFEEYPYVISYQLNNEKEDGEEHGLEVAVNQIEPMLPLVDINPDYYGYVTLTVDFPGAIIHYEINDSGVEHIYTGVFKCENGDKVDAYMTFTNAAGDITVTGPESTAYVTIGMIDDITSYTVVASNRWLSSSNTMYSLNPWGIYGDTTSPNKTTRQYTSYYPIIYFSPYEARIFNDVGPYDNDKAAINYMINSSYTWDSIVDADMHPRPVLETSDYLGSRITYGLGIVPNTGNWSAEVKTREINPRTSYLVVGLTYYASISDPTEWLTISKPGTIDVPINDSPVIGYILTPKFSYSSTRGYYYVGDGFGKEMLFSYNFSYLSSPVDSLGDLPHFLPVVNVTNPAPAQYILNNMNYDSDTDIISIPFSNNISGTAYIYSAPGRYDGVASGWTHDNDTHISSYTISGEMYSDKRDRIIYILPNTYTF